METQKTTWCWLAHKRLPEIPQLRQAGARRGRGLDDDVWTDIRDGGLNDEARSN